MRLFVLFVAAFLVAAPLEMAFAPPAHADGIERPRARRPARVRRQPAPEPVRQREEVRIIEDSRYVTLPASFFAGGGGVGADIGGGSYSSTTVIIRGGSASASASAFASARASAGARGFGRGGGHGGGCGGCR